MKLSSGFRANFCETELAICRRNRVIDSGSRQRQPRAGENGVFGQQVVEKPQGRRQPEMQAHARQDAECRNDGVRLDDL